MSKKKGTRIDVLGETFLPEDLLTPTEGSNYGLDGFPDIEYGSGLLIQFEDQDNSGLPEGMTAEEQAEAESKEVQDIFFDDEEDALGMDLTDAMKEAGLSDLNWLELNEQDPDRLPENPVYLGIPELEEAWGKDRRTDGLHFFDNVDLDQARYEAGLEDGKTAYQYTEADLTRVVRKAMRRSASGDPIRDILHQAAGSLGDEAPRIRRAMQIVKAEHGLAGNVFIRASAYPGYEQGKWKKALRKLGSARFIVVGQRTLTGSALIQNGRCTVTKKRAVLTVPWKVAYKHYAPKLTASGHKVAGSDPMKSLRAAFLSESTPARRLAEHRPIHKAPSERVSSKEARRKFKAAPRPERKVIDRTAGKKAKDRQAAWAKVNAWVDAGLVPRAEAMTLAGEDCTGKELLHRVSALIVRTKGASVFSGVANDMRPPSATKAETKAAMAVAKTAQKVIVISDRPEKVAKATALRTLARWVKNGFLSETDAKKLATAKVNAETLLEAASRLVFAPKDAVAYSGTVNDTRAQGTVTRDQVWTALRKAEKKAKAIQARVDQTARDRRGRSTVASRRIEAAKSKVDLVRQAIDKGVRGDTLRSFIRRTISADQAKLAGPFLVPLLKKTGALNGTTRMASTYKGQTFRPVAHRVASVRPAAREITAMLRWVKKAMNEGSAGYDLDGLLEARFSKTVREAGAEQLADLRDKHEGGAGFMYVDASAYVSKTGTKGCDKGGLQHRTNPIRYVLSADRCKGCTLRSKQADGTTRCRKYRKELVKASELPAGIRLVRRANIKQSNMGDAEVTASMFADTYDPSEFDLRDASMDDLQLDASPDAETLGEILFGGMEF